MINCQPAKTEKKILNQVKSVDDIQELYLVFYNDLFFYGLKLSGSEDVTKDCIQDMFLQFWANPESLKNVKSLKAYFLKCFRRRVLNHLADSKKLVNNDLVELKLINSLAVDPFESELIEKEHKNELIYKLISARKDLTIRQQEILYLKFNLGYNYDMICDIMDINYQSVRNLLSEAIRMLRHKIESKIAVA